VTPVRDLSEFMTFPFSSYEVKELDAPVAEEPPRAGEGGVDCWLCTTPDDKLLWAGERWRLNRAAGEQVARNLDVAA
jgi:hypothetical protein